MINPFLLRRWSATLLTGFLCTIAYVVGALYYGMFGGLAFFGVSILLAMLLSKVLLSNPFTLMLEGKGILAIDMNSTGLLRTFIVKVLPPYIQGVNAGRKVNDVFDREAVFNLAPPQVAGVAQSISGGSKLGGLRIEVGEEEYNRGRFAFFHYPVIIWNDQIGGIVTKDFFSEREKTAFAEHGVLYLNRKMEELTSAVRDFGRHVVEILKPGGGSILGKPWFWVVIVVLLVVLGILFGPAVFSAAKGVASTAGGAVSGATSGAIIPK